MLCGQTKEPGEPCPKRTESWKRTSIFSPAAGRHELLLEEEMGRAGPDDRIPDGAAKAGL
jgi:hypothetical protein